MTTVPPARHGFLQGRYNERPLDEPDGLRATSSGSSHRAKMRPRTFTASIHREDTFSDASVTAIDISFGCS